MPTVLAQLSLGATVVVIRLRSLGDTVLTTPALALLRQARPDLRVVVVVKTPFDAVLDGNPDVTAVLPVDRKAGIAERAATMWEIRRNRPELCLNLHGGATSAWMTALSGARHRAGLPTSVKAAPTTCASPNRSVEQCRRLDQRDLR